MKEFKKHRNAPVWICKDGTITWVACREAGGWNLGQVDNLHMGLWFKSLDEVKEYVNNADEREGA